MDWLKGKNIVANSYHAAIGEEQLTPVEINFFCRSSCITSAAINVGDTKKRFCKENCSKL